MFTKLTVQQLSDTLPVFRNRPKFALFANAVKFEIEGTLPNHPCDFYQLKTDDSEYYYCFRHNRLPDQNRPVLMIGNRGEIHEEDVVRGLERIKTMEPDLGKVSLVLAASRLATPTKHFLTTNFGLTEKSTVPCYNFSINEHSDIKNAPPLPPTFSIGSTRICDSETVNSTWKFATPEDILQQKEKIARLPTACVFHNNRPVAFEMVGLHGQLSHQYTFPEYRNKGLGTVVEKCIVDKCVGHGIVPVKSVELGNESVLRRSMEHSVWKVVEDEDGEIVTFDYINLD